MHEHATTPNVFVDKNYICSLQGIKLYEAKIKEFSGCGCWAKVEIVNIFNSPHEKHYHIGQNFEIKIALYSLEEV